MVASNCCGLIGRGSPEMSSFLIRDDYVRIRTYWHSENSAAFCDCRQDQDGETPVVAASTGTEKRDESRPEVRQIDIGKEAAMEAEVKAARERAIIPLEIRMKQFRDMLSEKEVGVIVINMNSY